LSQDNNQVLLLCIQQVNINFTNIHWTFCLSVDRVNYKLLATQVCWFDKNRK